MGAIRTTEELLSSIVRRVRLLERRLSVRGAIPSSRLAMTGEVKMWPLPTAPDGWVFATGQALSRAEYSDLFALYGTTFGAGDGATTFNVIDMRGRAPVGRDAGQTEFDVLGESGGAKTHTISDAEMPVSSVIYGGAAATSFYVPISGGNQPNAYIAKVHRNPAATQTAMNNLSPYRVVNFIIKA